MAQAGRGRLAEFGKEHGQFFDSSLGKSYNERPEGAPPTPEQIAEIRRIVDRFADLMPVVSRIASCEKYASLADFTLPPDEYLETQLASLSELRALARRQQWRIETLIADGRSDEAAEAGRELLIIARLHEQEPLLVNYLVTLAIYGIAAESIGDVISAGDVSDEVYERTVLELSKSVSRDGFVNALKAERAFMLSHDPQQVFAGCGPEIQLSFIERTFGQLVGWTIKRHVLDPAEHMNRVISALNNDRDKITVVLEDPELFSETEKKGVFIALLQPALGAAIEAHCRAVAKTRSVRVCSALQRFEQNIGHLATGLLIPDLPTEAKTDPYTGESLKFKHTELGWVVYSTGINRVDDGGRLLEYEDIGYAPPAVRLEQSKKK